MVPLFEEFELGSVGVAEFGVGVDADVGGDDADAKSAACQLIHQDKLVESSMKLRSWSDWSFSSHR